MYVGFKHLGVCWQPWLEQQAMEDSTAQQGHE